MEKRQAEACPISALVAERLRVALDVCRWMHVGAQQTQTRINTQVAEAHRSLAHRVMDAIAARANGGRIEPPRHQGTKKEGREISALTSVELVLGKMVAAVEHGSGPCPQGGTMAGQNVCGSIPAEHEAAVMAVLAAMDGQLGELAVTVAADRWAGALRRTVTARWAGQ
jgi:hypothetical protein